MFSFDTSYRREQPYRTEVEQNFSYSENSDYPRRPTRSRPVPRSCISASYSGSFDDFRLSSSYPSHPHSEINNYQNQNYNINYPSYVWAILKN